MTKQKNDKLKVSIHAPSEGSDFITTRRNLRNLAVSIHAPSEGSDMYDYLFASTSRFQSTLPVKGATCSCSKSTAISEVSIHAPSEGSDCRM